MRTVLKWLGYLLGGLVGLIIIAVLAIYFISESKTSKTYSVQPATVAMASDAATLERGNYLVSTIGGCRDCHGKNLEGAEFLPAPVGPLYAPNLTKGKGSATSAYKDEDWVRSIRHGVRPNGQGLFIMPAQDFYNFSDADLSAVIAYVKSVPPADNTVPTRQFGPLGRFLLTNGGLPMPAADSLPHTAARTAAPARGATPDYGKYLASIACMGCHGTGLSGGVIPGVPPEWPPAMNLTPSGELIGWTEAQFMATLRTGKTPAGRELRPQYMPWENFKQLTDDDLKAVWAFLKTVPAKANGTR
jgi:mono/diheme cytochrome c family protein